MRKVMGIVLLLALAIGAFGLTAAQAATCAGPVSVDCTDTKGTTGTADDEHCLVYVDVAEAGVKDCIGESDVPPPPAL